MNKNPAPWNIGAEREKGSSIKGRDVHKIISFFNKLIMRIGVVNNVRNVGFGTNSVLLVQLVQ